MGFLTWLIDALIALLSDPRVRKVLKQILYELLRIVIWIARKRRPQTTSAGT